MAETALRGCWRVAGRHSQPFGVFGAFGGTGKTMSAELIAATLRFDVYRIDLSEVMSKYIGQTEKSLAALFGAAEASGSVLLFDESDSLFGGRSGPSETVPLEALLGRMAVARAVAFVPTKADPHLAAALGVRRRSAGDIVSRFTTSNEGHRWP